MILTSNTEGGQNRNSKIESIVNRHSLFTKTQKAP
jgi:hypothetical protein